MSILVSALLYRAQRIAGILGTAGRGASPETDSDTFLILNSMVDAMKTENLFVWATLRNVFNTSSNVQTYTIGPGGDWDTDLPEKINLASWIYTNNSPTNEVPLDIINTQQWQALTPKLTTSTAATKLYFEPDIPLGRVYLWPVPLGSWQVALYLWKMLQQFTSPTQVIDLKPGYQKMLEYNLAVELAGQFPAQQKMSANSIAIAKQTRATIKQMNAPDLLMRVDPGAMGVNQRGGYRIRSNSYTSGN